MSSDTSLPPLPAFPDLLSYQRVIASLLMDTKLRDIGHNVWILVTLEHELALGKTHCLAVVVAPG